MLPTMTAAAFSCARCYYYYIHTAAVYQSEVFGESEKESIRQNSVNASASQTDNDADNEGVMVTGGDEVRSVVPDREVERRNQVNVS